MTSDLLEFVRQHTEILRPDEERPCAEIVDVSFHRMAVVGNPDRAAFKTLIEANCDETTNPLNGKLHQFTNIAHWLGGDLNDAANFMGLLDALQLAKLDTPKTLIDPALGQKEEIRYRLMGMFWVSTSVAAQQLEKDWGKRLTESAVTSRLSTSPLFSAPAPRVLA